MVRSAARGCAFHRPPVRVLCPSATICRWLMKSIHSYSEEKLLAKKIAIAATDLSKFDSAKYSLVYQPDSTGPNGAPVFDVYSVPANASTVFCFGSVAL